ncbi:MAG: GNAT family N-acetyltransferase, partial [Chloroflexota bacterium]
MSSPSKIQIRPFESSDVEIVNDIDHSYHTEQVWQMDFNQNDAEIGVIFRQVRLPRSMHVEYPYTREGGQVFDAAMISSLEGFSAVIDEKIVGYIHLKLGKAPSTAWISNFAILRRLRRQGIGKLLVIQAEKWAREQGCKRLVLEAQSKNYPAISIANNLGFEFSGYSDQYYENQDIA